MREERESENPLSKYQTLCNQMNLTLTLTMAFIAEGCNKTSNDWKSVDLTIHTIIPTSVSFIKFTNTRSK